jgi:hypothetical protein
MPLASRFRERLRLAEGVGFEPTDARCSLEPLPVFARLVPRSFVGPGGKRRFVPGETHRYPQCGALIAIFLGRLIPCGI